MKEKLKLFEEFESYEEKKKLSSKEMFDLIASLERSVSRQYVLEIIKQDIVEPEIKPIVSEEYKELQKNRSKKMSYMELGERMSSTDGTATYSMQGFSGKVIATSISKDDYATKSSSNILSVIYYAENEVHYYIGTIEKLWERVADKAFKMKRREVHKKFGI